MSLRPQNDPEHQSKSLHKTDDYWCTPLIRQLEKSDLPDRFKLTRRLRNCAQYRRYGLNSGKKPNYCHLRYLCKACADRYAKRVALEYATKILGLMIQFGLCPFFVTLSPRAENDLVQQLVQVERMLNKIRQKRKNHFSHGTQFTEFCRFLYAFVILEVKRTQDGQLWFPHVHFIALNPLADVRFNLSDLATEWRMVSESEIPPHVKSTTAGKLFRRCQRSDSISEDMKGKIFRDLQRIIQYALKPLPLCLSDQIVVHSAMRGTHRYREWAMPKSHGQFHSSKV